MIKEKALELNNELCREWKKAIPLRMKALPDKRHDKIIIDIFPVYIATNLDILPESFKKCLGNSLLDLIKLEINLYFREDIISCDAVPIAENYILFHYKETDCVLRGFEELITRIQKTYI